MTEQPLRLLSKAEFESAFVSMKRILVTRDYRKVYDVTHFAESHPGGADLVRDWAGKDVTDIMKDEVSHEHSDIAYDMLEEDFLVAILATESEEKELLVEGNESQVYKLQPADSEGALNMLTDFSRDYKENKFLDLGRPLLMQMLTANFSKEFYLQQVHKPRHYGNGSAPLFGNFLEPLSMTPWWVVPMVWIPADIYCISLALQGLWAPYTAALFTLGVFIWTLVEYLLHRFLFHLDEYLPSNQVAFTLHFLLHGVHHYLPMDRMRLVMPPALLVVLTTPLYKLAHFVFRDYHMSMAVFAGAFLGYVMYDCTHYFLHHANLPPYLKKVKAHHLDHHYKNFELGFGVTSDFWDRVFGTQFVDTSRIK